MDRSLAARSTRPFGAGTQRRARPSRAARASADRRGRPRLPRLLRRFRSRLALIAVLVSLPLLGGGWLLLRNSSLVAVSHVRVTGAAGPQASAIEAALETAARHMSTLNVNVAALRAAVAPFHIVRGLHVRSSFPHGLRIAVEEERPVAALLVEGARTAVAADGVVLGQALLRASLPAVQASSAPPVGGRVSNYYVRVSLAVVAAAPRPLARLITRAFLAPQGVAVELHGGLVAYFGDASRPHAKWISLARVLADPSSGGATYVDVRLPERPAAGFGSAGAAAQPSSGAGTTSEKPGTRESSVQALAEGLGAPSGSAAANAAAAAGGAGASSPTEASEAKSGAGTATTPETASQGHESEAGSQPAEGSTSTGG